MERANNPVSSQERGISTLETAARLAGCRPEEILALRVTPEGGLSIIDPSGRKLAFSPNQFRFAVESASRQNPRASVEKAGTSRSSKRRNS